MPWRICEIGNNKYEVINCITGKPRGTGLTLEKAQAQLRILNKAYKGKSSMYKCSCGCSTSKILRKTTSDRGINKPYEKTKPE